MMQAINLSSDICISIMKCYRQGALIHIKTPSWWLKDDTIDLTFKPCSVLNGSQAACLK